MSNPEIEENLREAVAAYGDGVPVVVLDEQGHALHGHEFLRSLVALEMNMSAFLLEDVPRSYFEESQWPETLEAARQAFLKTPIG